MSLSTRWGRGRRSAIVVLVAGLVLLATPLAVWGQAADEAPTFTGFSLEADASGMSIIFGNPDSQPYPLGLGTVPSTVSSLSTGPSGFAQASAAWPGPLASNAGSLAATLLPLCDPTGRGICTPKPDNATLALLNYPVRAEASSPAGQSDDAQGPLYAHSKDNASSANATVADPTGVFFDEQTADALAEAVERFERDADRFDPSAARRQAVLFRKERFETELFGFLDRVLGGDVAARRAA